MVRTSRPRSTKLQQVRDLRVPASEMAEKAQPVDLALDQKRDVARHQPGWAIADQQTEIVPLDVRIKTSGLASVKPGGR